MAQSSTARAAENSNHLHANLPHVLVTGTSKLRSTTTVSFGPPTVGALILYNQSKAYYPSTYSDIPTGYVGLVGRLTYDYDSKYMAEFNIGYNGSENFHPDRRFGTFPAGSIGWVVSNESSGNP